MEFTHSVPYEYMTSYVNYSCSEMCATLLPMLKEQEEVKKIVTSLLILRQPITYIHSLMESCVSVILRTVCP